jgi:hypothetical protein
MQTKEEIKAALDNWQLSGKSVSAYCKEHGLREHQFRYWQKKLLPRQTSTQKSRQAPKGFIAMNLSMPGGMIEFIHTTGQRIIFHHTVPVSVLKQLLD